MGWITEIQKIPRVFEVFHYQIRNDTFANEIFWDILIKCLGFP